MTYPTTAQLQELRDQLGEAQGVNVFGPDEGAAWQTERENGIGFRGAAQGLVPDLSWSMQRWIGEMRERVYGRTMGPSLREVDELERTLGMTLDEWPELPQPTWPTRGVLAETLDRAD
jgi:hypothetical protein